MRKIEILSQISLRNFIKYFNAFALIVLLFYSYQSQAQCSLICRPSLNVSLGYDVLRLTPADILSSVPSACASNLIVEIIDQNGNVRGDTVLCEYVGKTIVTRVRDKVNNNSCTSSIVVYDGSSPRITCLDTFISCNVSYAPGAVFTPIYYDNCTPTNLITKQFNDDFIDYDCFTAFNNRIVTAKIIRHWVVTDLSGNSNSCNQNIYLERKTIQQVVFPPNRDGFAAPFLLCNQDNPNDLNITGYPTLSGVPYNNAGSCELSITFSDITINNCGASKTVLREWRASDWCNGEFIIKTQIIKVVDNIAPIITCPIDRTISTDQNNCSATLVLPLASGTDNCSSFTYNVTSSFGNGYNINAVPIGTHTIVYKAMDACNNQSSCSMQLTVVDKIIPVAICQSNINVTLSNQGIGKLFAIALDNSSHDNCQILNYKASRDSINFIDTLDFNCIDIHKSPIKAYLKVKDIHGNENICTSNIKIKDTDKPTIICPKDTIINCNEDHTLTYRFGSPSYADNCNIKSISKLDSINLNICKTGQIFRKWVVEDSSGNTNYCVQKITKQDTTSFNIIFPVHYKTYNCTLLVDTSVSGAPILNGYECEFINVKYEDNIINNNYPSCYKILRKWTVINWCNYNPITNTGYYQYNQVIDIIDTLAPLLKCPKDTIVKIIKDCEVFVKLPDATATDCSTLITITNNSLFAFQNLESATGNYPLGTTNISFFAEDNCGNLSTCLFKIVVLDTIKPKAICKAYQLVQLDTSLTAFITPLFVNKMSTDNCTDSAHLILNLSKTNFSCSNLGLNIVKLYVKDLSGNIDSCSGYINIYNSRRDCPNSYEGIISGNITDELAVPIANVNIYNGDILGTNTNLDGSYTLSGLPILENFYIRPELNTNILNGVTTADINVIRKHILGLNILNSPYKMIAADVNRSSTITSLDMLQIRQLILRIATSFSNNKSWRFLDANQNFNNINNPFLDIFKESIFVESLNNTALNKNFIGIKIGDVNNSSDNIANLRTTEEIIYEPNAIVNNQLSIPFRLKKAKKILGFQLQIDFDPKQIHPLSIKSSLPDFNPSNYIINRDNIILSYDNLSELKMDTLFEIMASKQDAKKEINFTLNHQYFNFVFDDHSQSVFTLGNNHNLEQNVKVYPNPFDDKLFLEIKSEMEDFITIQVYNMEGILLLEQKQNLIKGTSVYPINQNDVMQLSNNFIMRIVGQNLNYSTKLTKMN